MPDDGLSPETRAELSAIVADLERSGALLDARTSPFIRWRDVGKSGLITPMDINAEMIKTEMPTVPPGELYANLVEMWHRYVRVEQERIMPYGDPRTWTVVEASAGTLPDGYAMAVVSPMCWYPCGHTHMVLIQQPDKPQADEMKEPEVYRREAAWWRRPWIVVSRHAGTRRFWTRWRANRWALQEARIERLTRERMAQLKDLVE
jgi:hypothetical protein